MLRRVFRRWNTTCSNGIGFELTEKEMEQLKTLDENKTMWAEYDDPMIVKYAMEEV